MINIFRTLIIALALELQFLYEIPLLVSLIVFILTVSGPIIGLAKHFQTWNRRFRLQKLLYFTVPVSLLFIQNSIMATVTPLSALFQVNLIVSSIALFAFFQENDPHKHTVEQHFFHVFARHYIFFIIIWCFNLLNIQNEISFLQTSIFSGLFIAFYFIFNLFLVQRLGLKNSITCLIIGLLIGLANLNVNGFYFDPYGIVNALMMIFILDVIATIYYHSYIASIDNKVWNRKLLMMFLTLILTIQIINTSTFPQRVASPQEVFGISTVRNQTNMLK